MNPEIKEKWIAALKSGKYVKGNGLLKHQDGEIIRQCCLGVLCEIHHEETGEGGWEEKENDVSYYKSNAYASTVILPEPVQEWAALHHHAGEFLPDEEDVAKLTEKGVEMRVPGIYISEINDKIEGDDFSEIIPFIEKYF